MTSISKKDISDIQESFGEWITLIESTTNAFRKHFSQMVVLYESSDPASSIITNEALAEFKQTKSDIIKHISGLSLLKELDTYEQLKLSFQLAHLIETYQIPLRQMREALDSARIKESITSSDNSHMMQISNILYAIYSNFISNSHKIQQYNYDALLHQINTDIDIGKLNELDKKYHVITFYSALLNYILKHHKNTDLIENVELLKDRILETKQTSSKFPFTFQMFDLIGGEYTTLENIFGSKLSLDKISKQLSVDGKQFDIIVITRPTSYVYNPWTLSTPIEYDCIDQSVIEQFKTMKPVKSTISKSVKIYSYSTKDMKRTNPTKKYYYVLETYDGEHYRVMIPWQVFPGLKSSIQYIPQSWLPGFDNYEQNYPSGRIVAYNDLIEEKILKFKGIEKESKIQSIEINKERGYIVDKLSTWFIDSIKKNTPTSLSDYRELINGDDFNEYIEMVLIELLLEKYDKSITLLSTASLLMRRISREILGIITKSASLKNMFDLYPDKVKNELPSIFKNQIQQCVEIVVSYNSLLSPIDKKLELDLHS
jgi:hypothetical protein